MEDGWKVERIVGRKRNDGGSHSWVHMKAMKAQKLKTRHKNLNLVLYANQSSTPWNSCGRELRSDV